MTDGREIDKFAETPIYQSFVRDMIGRSNLTHTASGPCTRKKFDMFPEFVGGDDTAQPLLCARWSAGDRHSCKG